MQMLDLSLKSSKPHLTNVALNKPAWMSTISFITTSPNNANDGAFNTDIRFCVHSLFETKDTLPYRFWRCDLKGLYQIFYVRVTNRGDCCGYRMQQISIDVARTMVDPMARNLVDDQLCVFHIPQICQGCTEQLDCTKPLIGRYVTITIPRIWIKGAFSTLNLCSPASKVDWIPLCYVL
ncbi:fucolectin-like [Babylonia areolata]|uniref:fucolectin-like n=1 Tax=Babylonia areolata TaxID=304850 RepID=UPI003FD21830